jgi:hypothetical protein
MLNNAKQVKPFTVKNIAPVRCHMLFYLNVLLHFNVVKNLIRLYEARVKPEKAEEWRAKLPKMEAVEE